MNFTLSPLNAISYIHLLDGFIQDWMVTRKYIKNGKEVVITGFGRTKAEALQDFNDELQIEREQE